MFLDYSKAFDRVNHNILLKKFSNMDIPPALLKWLATFVQGRSQCVRLGDTMSDEVYMNGAMPQEPMFGMEGFLTLINDLRTDVPH